MSRGLLVLASAQGLDLLTFAVAMLVVGVPASAESNPLYRRGFLAGGLLLVVILKASFAVVMLYLARRLNRNRTLGIGVASTIGLVGACSNVWTSLVWLDLQGN